MSVHVSILSCLTLSVCLSCCFYLCVCLFVDEGAEDKVGPLHSCLHYGPTASGERRKHLAPSISVSVPDDDPCHSDEEYYEHPLFSSEWNDSNTLPSATVQSAEALLSHEKGELNMVPFCSSSPPPCQMIFIPLYMPGATSLGLLFFPHNSEVPLESTYPRMRQGPESQMLWCSK